MSFRHRLDEALIRVASLELQLQMRVMNTSSEIDDGPIAQQEVEDMHDFINAMDSSNVFVSSPTKRARTSLSAHPFSSIEGSRGSIEQAEEISKLRHELEQCIRENEAAKAVAAEAYAVAVAAKRTCKNVQSVRRGTKGSS